MKKNAPIYGLVCAGGGAHGAYQVGVLKYIHENFCNANQSPFRVFAGSSCGSLNTSFFAARSHDAKQSCYELEELWNNFHIPSYHGNLLKNSVLSVFRSWREHQTREKYSWSLLDAKPIEEAVKKGFSRDHLKIALKKKSTLGVAISATELISGRTCWFLEGPSTTSWNLPDSIGLQDHLTPTHLQASCSIPVFLPPIKIGDRYYLDGSVSLARPLSAAISMGATKVLRIATDKPLSLDLPDYDKLFVPKLSHVIRMLIDQLTHDRSADEAMQIEKLNQFYAEINQNQKAASVDSSRHGLPIFHAEFRPDNYRPIDLCLFFPSKRIRKRTRSNAAPRVHESNHDGKSSQSRFMFNKNFIVDLIEMGYQDAQSKAKELQNFFTPEESHNRRWFLFAK